MHQKWNRTTRWGAGQKQILVENHPLPYALETAFCDVGEHDDRHRVHASLGNVTLAATEGRPPIHSLDYRGIIGRDARRRRLRDRSDGVRGEAPVHPK